MKCKLCIYVSPRNQIVGQIKRMIFGRRRRRQRQRRKRRVYCLIFLDYNIMAMYKYNHILLYNSLRNYSQHNNNYYRYVINLYYSKLTDPP
ncbi:hypothetical protein QTP88_000281 [Uroleucon formosanum]